MQEKASREEAETFSLTGQMEVLLRLPTGQHVLRVPAGGAPM